MGHLDDTAYDQSGDFLGWEHVTLSSAQNNRPSGQLRMALASDMSEPADGGSGIISLF